MTDHQVDLSDASQVRKLKANARQHEDQFTADVDKLLGMVEGRRFIWFLLSGVVPGAGAMEDPYGGSPTDTAYRCGMQAVARKLLALCMEPKRMRDYIRMAVENGVSK